jgi:hypothetical protein
MIIPKANDGNFMNSAESRQENQVSIFEKKESNGACCSQKLTGLILLISPPSVESLITNIEVLAISSSPSSPSD